MPGVRLSIASRLPVDATRWTHLV
eukprot:SAG25_NODE_1942_length_2115_cov_2.612599_4_plen_23_part_01